MKDGNLKSDDLESDVINVSQNKEILTLIAENRQKREKMVAGTSGDV